MPRLLGVVPFLIDVLGLAVLLAAIKRTGNFEVVQHPFNLPIRFLVVQLIKIGDNTLDWIIEWAKQNPYVLIVQSPLSKISRQLSPPAKTDAANLSTSSKALNYGERSDEPYPPPRHPSSENSIQYRYMTTHQSNIATSTSSSHLPKSFEPTYNYYYSSVTPTTILNQQPSSYPGSSAAVPSYSLATPPRSATQSPGSIQLPVYVSRGSLKDGSYRPA
jgi:hypothetical protein